MPIDDANLLRVLAEVLVRQAHPTEVDDMGRVMTPAFKSSKRHDFSLSVTMSSQIDPRLATKQFLKLDLLTHSAWGVSVEEFHSVGMKAYNDPDAQIDAHAVVDQKPLGSSALKKAATRLGEYARSRGCLCIASEIVDPDPTAPTVDATSS